MKYQGVFIHQDNKNNIITLKLNPMTCVALPHLKSPSLSAGWLHCNDLMTANEGKDQSVIGKAASSTSYSSGFVNQGNKSE